MDQPQDRITPVFDGRTIFITGGTGFLGRVLVEKLLRSCNVKTLYLLVRTKKGKTAQNRLHEFFDNMLFDRLKNEKPGETKKCQIIEGDITQINLGISEEDRHLLQEEVDFIFHSAASTRFDDSVTTALIFNTRSTQYMLDLAEGCKKLKVFMHVSTAYAFPNEKTLYDKAYEPMLNYKLLDEIDYSKEKENEKLLGDCPNSYTFSKALAEKLVIKKMDKIPAIIVRPSVVCPTMVDPIPGWCHNLQGPMGLFVGAGKGVIRSMYMTGDTPADFIPADYVIRGMLVCTWNYLHNSKKDNIVNLTASTDFTFRWEEVIETGKDILYNEMPFNGVVWYPGGSIKKNKLVHNICFYLFQLIPGIFLDGLLILLGYKPILYQIQRRIQKGGEIFEYYTTRAWDLRNDKISEIRKKLNGTETSVYKVDAQGIELKNYLKDCVLCVRRNNLKEMDDTLPAARRHLKIMRVVDIVTKLVVSLTFLYYIYVWVWRRL